MANISSAHGKLTLIGNWTNEAIEALAASIRMLGILW